MERLTYYDNYDSPCFKMGGMVYSNRIAERLAQYEDSGLSPEEVLLLAKLKSTPVPIPQGAFACKKCCDCDAFQINKEPDVKEDR